jgi:hypothetical protein
MRRYWELPATSQRSYSQMLYPVLFYERCRSPDRIFGMCVALSLPTAQH